MALGDAMTAEPDDAKDGRDPEESGIPALYTYFGQFIDHDITFDPMTTLISHSDPDALTDFRTPALDLDNMYGRGPDDQPYMYDDTGRFFVLGNPLDDPNTFDLPRNNKKPARAIIGDPRNDENTIISQFQGLMLTFHNRVAKDNPDLDFRSVQKIVRWHYQWVVINDFLPRIVTKDVITSLKNEGGQYDQSKIKFYHWKNEPFMPVEFSAAAYRLGHSMIRPGYRMNDTVLRPIFAKPGAADQRSLAGFQAVAPENGIDWKRFIDIGPARPWGDLADAHPTASIETQQRLQFAYRLDTSIVNPLSTLPESVAPDIPRSLAQRNLLRGFELGLPTGQDVAKAMGIKPLDDKEILIGKKLDKYEGDDKPPFNISNHAELTVFKGKCPLWTYILAEAMNYEEDTPIHVEPAGTKVKTPQLGPVGGRIVAEVFLGMLFGDKDSFLSRDPAWIPTIGVDPAEVNPDFKLADLVKYAIGA